MRSRTIFFPSAEILPRILPGSFRGILPRILPRNPSAEWSVNPSRSVRNPSGSFRNPSGILPELFGILPQILPRNPSADPSADFLPRALLKKRLFLISTQTASFRGSFREILPQHPSGNPPCLAFFLPRDPSAKPFLGSFRGKEQSLRLFLSSNIVIILKYTTTMICH